jgi:dynein heavy chain 1
MEDQLFKAYEVIEGKLREVHEYVSIWLRYQALWDLQPSQVYDKLGDELPKWQQILQNIRKARGTFDNSESERSFGAIAIDYEQVQSKVNAKYDSWQKEIVAKFAEKLGIGMRDFFNVVSKARTDLEGFSVDADATADTIAFITMIQDLKRKIPQWTKDTESFRSGQKLLERQRFQFPPDWLYGDNVDGEWSSFMEIYNRKNAAFQEQIGMSDSHHRAFFCGLLVRLNI